MTRTRRSRSVSAGTNGSHRDRGRRGRESGFDRVRRDRQQADGPVEPSLLEQAAAPALARRLPFVADADLRAVRGQREPGPGGGVGHDLRAAIAAGPDDCGRLVALDELGDGGTDRLGRVDVEAGVLDRRGGPRRHWRRAHRRSRPRRCPRRPRGAARPVAPARARPSASASTDRRSGRATVVLDDDEDHAISPRRRKTSTTRGAASGPSPRISTALSCSTGTRSRIRAVVAAARVGSDPLDVLLAGPQASRHGRVARQVEPLSDAQHGRPRDLVDLPAATGRLAPGDDRVVPDLDDP